MRVIGRLLALLIGGLTVVAGLGAMAAQRAKREIVPIDDPEANDVRLAAIFEPISFRSTATGFRGGTLDCWYGGGVVDLRKAVLDPAGASLEVKARFGGAQILVPDSWQITTRVTGIGGAADARPRIERAGAPHLTIQGTAFFGGFGVASDLPEVAAQGLEDAVAKAVARHHPADIAEREGVAAR